VVFPQTSLDAVFNQAKELANSYGCGENPDAIEAFQYLLLIPPRDTTMPCLMQIEQFLTAICSDSFELVF